MRASREDRADIEHALREAGGRRAECPLCVRQRGKRDAKRSLALFADGGFYCFRCAVSGKLEGAVDLRPTEVEVLSIEPPDEYVPLWLHDNATSITYGDAANYLEARKVHRAVWADYAIGACADGYYGGRVIVPIVTELRDAWLGFVARDWTGNADRAYLYPRGMKRDRLLFNGEALTQQRDEPIIIVEGVFDAMALGADGVAVLGKPTRGQTEMLLASERDVCFALDGDAHEEAWALAVRFRFEGRRAGYVRLPPGKDPDEVDRGWLLEEARRSLDVDL